MRGADHTDIGWSASRISLFLTEGSVNGKAGTVFISFGKQVRSACFGLRA